MNQVAGPEGFKGRALNSPTLGNGAKRPHPALGQPLSHLRHRLLSIRGLAVEAKEVVNRATEQTYEVSEIFGRDAALVVVPATNRVDADPKVVSNVVELDCRLYRFADFPEAVVWHLHHGRTVTASCKFCKSISASRFSQKAEVLYRSPTMEPGIASALASAAKRAREAKNITPEEMATALKETGPGSTSKVSRFENRKQHREFDRTLSVYSEVTGRSLIQLLKDAEDELNEAKPAPKTKLSKKQQAELNAERHEAELESELAVESQQSRPNGKHSAKSEPESESR